MKNLLIRQPLISILIILFLITSISGLGYYFVLSLEIELLQLVYIAIFYMPTPFYSLLIYSLITRQNLITKYISLEQLKLKNFLKTIMIFFVWSVAIVTVTFVLAQIFPDQFGEIATTDDQLLANIEEFAGSEAAENTDLPPTPLLLVPLAFIAALATGFTINMIFAMGEEILWRGYMWDKLRKLPEIYSVFIIGPVWGLWHAPLILQGYNYGEENAVMGVFMFVVFCTAFSLLFAELMRRTKSTIMAAGLHGMFNAFVGVFSILIVDANPFLDGAIGIVSVMIMVVIYLLLKLLPN